MDRINERELSGEVIVVRPPEALGISRTEKDSAELERVYQIGRATALGRLESIRKFLRER